MKNGVVATGGVTPLITASVYGPLELVEVLLDAGAQVNAVDVKGMTLLMFSVATDHQNPRIAQILLTHGADRDKRSLAGETALDSARKVGATRGILALGTTARAQASAKPRTGPRPALRDAIHVKRKPSLFKSRSVFLETLNSRSLSASTHTDQLCWPFCAGLSCLAITTRVESSAGAVDCAKE